MAKRLDLSGLKYGKLTILRREKAYRDVKSKIKRTRTQWFCMCDCGNTITVMTESLKTGNTKSCGCLHTLHGFTKTPEFRIWTCMMTRCYNKNHDAYMNYGGRGIIIEAIWHTFLNFLRDMGKRPPGMTIDRLDNDKNYGPGNCRWASTKQQSWNQRKRKNTSSKFIGVSKTRSGKFKAELRNLEGIKEYLGEFVSDVEAAKEYDKKAVEYRGEDAYLNFPENKGLLLTEALGILSTHGR